MNLTTMPRHTVIDDFLPEREADRLLTFALEHRDAFTPATVIRQGTAYDDNIDRKAHTSRDLGPSYSTFTAAVEAHAERLCKDVGLAPFPIAGWDVELAVHRDGGFFHEHIDTMTAESRDVQSGDRVISLVYYLHLPNARFTGGDLVLRPFRGGPEEVRIAPRHNRLVGFPSFARHEVETIHVPGNGWEDARFSVNCWLLRGRD